MVVSILKEDKFGEMYRSLLGFMLDKLSDWIGDRRELKPRYSLQAQQKLRLKPLNQFFSRNPFTAPSYELLLGFAFVYPILSFLVVWVLGGDGSVAGIHWVDNSLADVPSSTRWQLLIFVFIIPVIITLYLKRQRFKVQAIFLGLASGLGLDRKSVV